MTDRRAAWSRTKRSLRNSVGFFLCTDAFSTNFRLHDQLQRGRATGGAELPPARRELAAATALQRGRATGGAEFSFASSISAVCETSLQRGRATGGAELHWMMSETGCLCCFNGAAPRGARNSRRSPRHTRTMSRFNGAAPRGARNFVKACGRAVPFQRRFNGAAPRGARNW